MKHAEFPLKGRGGRKLVAQSWHPDGDASAVVLISHGFGEHIGRYAHVIDYLVDRGYAVYALDHRGHGRSEGRRGMIDRYSYLVEDFHGLTRHAADEHSELKRFLIGHSMGGAIAVGYALAHQAELSGLILSAPACGGEQLPIRAWQNAMIKMMSAVAPTAGTVAIPSETISRDPDVVRAYDTDPLVHRGKIPARTTAELLEATRFLPPRFSELKLPLLLLHGSADQLSPVGNSRAVHERASSADKTLKVYGGLYHEVFNEPEKEQVLAELASWLDAHR